MMKIMMFLRLSCLTKNCPRTRLHLRTFPSRRKGTICHRPLAGSSSRGCINAPSATNASSITPSSSNTRGSTVGCSLTTALSVAGPSEQPPSWPVTGSGNAKMPHICALNAGTVFQPHWTNSDTTAQSVAVTTIAGGAERLFKSRAA